MTFKLVAAISAVGDLSEVGRGAWAAHRAAGIRGADPRAPEQHGGVAFDVLTVAGGLENPWGLAFLPDGRMLVTERPGRLRIVALTAAVAAGRAGFPRVDARGQGGLLDVALDPGFATNGLIYWSYAEPRDGGTNNTAVARGTFVDGAAPRRRGRRRSSIIRRRRCDSRLHFGSRLVFGRDGTLFVTQGERSITEGRMQAQRMDGLLGKIVRINPDGSIPKDNPFVGKDGARPEIWSLGHRNVQAAALHPTTGELWEVEHGTRGGDEINIVAQGQGLRLADDRLRHRIPRRADHRRHHRQGRHGAAAATTGIR